MYANSGYLKNEDIDLEDYNYPLLITSCGNYRLLHKKVMSTSRPNGRTDYQLLYVASGKAYFHFNRDPFSKPETTLPVPESSMIAAPAGSIVVYYPGQMQLYEYFLEDRPDVYWVHFTGRDADSLLNQIGLSKTQAICINASDDYRELFRQMIRELQLKRPCCEDLLALYMRQLFCRVQRNRLENAPGRFQPSREIKQAIHYFHESFTQDICIEDYAETQHISVCWFIRSFKKYTGVTPRQYLTALRMNRAKELLQVSNDSIQEIANVVGYEDPLYFSRVFKKHTGHSPTWYRHP